MSRRFVELRDGMSFLVLDMKDETRPVIVCRCEGYNAPLNAEYVAEALQSYHDHLMDRIMGKEIAPSDIEGAGC